MLPLPSRRALRLAAFLGGLIGPVLLAPAPLAGAEPGATRTLAEKTGFRDTGRYEEVGQLCRAFESAYPRRARCFSIGKTPEGRDIWALAASSDGTLDAADARARRRPVIFFQGGIHAGEIDGKDAGFWFLRELLDGARGADTLRAVTALFVPVINPDGHERFGPNHRPNQRGPRETGFRTTARNLNLNRDYIKADAPETRLALALFRAWDPIVLVDLHATDGAKFEHDIAVMVSPRAPRTARLVGDAAALSRAIQVGLTQKGHLPLDFYPSFVKNDEPDSGFESFEAPPRFSTAYYAARNRIGVLVETHSWRTYRERVESTRDTLSVIFDEARARARDWRSAADEADGRGVAAYDGVTLSWKAGPTARTIDFRGYAYERRPSEVSGGTRIVYDETKRQIWRIPLRDQMVPDVDVRAPGAGYVIPAGWSQVVAEILDAHGVEHEPLPREVRGASVEVFRARDVAFDPPFEGRTRARFTGEWAREPQDLPAGSLFVPLTQARALVAMHLLEPLAPDSLAAWGTFNAVFEQKEYMEAYVLEDEARRMLDRDPALRRAYEGRVRSDDAFAKDPAARLRFFYERHPSRDVRLGLVPVVRVDRAPR